MDWDYKRKRVHLTMTKYATKALKQFHHKLKKRQPQPFPSANIVYGTKKTVCTTAVRGTSVGQRRQKVHTESV